MKLTKQRCFDPRDPDYDGPDDEECQELDFDSDEPPDDDSVGDPASDYIMTNYENYVNSNF